MGTNIKAGTFQKTATSTVDQSVTGLGFQPKAIIFSWTFYSSTGYTVGDFVQGIGFTDGTNQWMTTVSVLNASATPTANRKWRNNRVIGAASSSGVSLLAGAHIVSMDSNGFTIHWDENDSGTWVIGYLAIGGSSISAFVGATEFVNSSGNHGITGVGFQPAGVLLAGLGTDVTTLAGTDTRANYYVGAGDGTRQQVISGGAPNLTTATASKGQNSSAILQTHADASDTRTLTNVATLASLDADGFTLNFSTVHATQRAKIGYLCIAGTGFYVNKDTAKTSTGTKATSGVGFAPGGLLLFSWGRTASASVTFDPHWASGATDGTNQWAITGQDTSTSPNQCTTEILSTKALAFLPQPPSGGADSSEAGISSLDADGFTLNWTKAGGAADEFWYVALGPTDTAPTITAGPSVSYGSLTRTGPSNTPWTFSFTAHDPEQTGVNALTWTVYTGAGRTGTLVASGTCTSDVGVGTTIAYNAAGLVEGNQTLYLSVDDGIITSADSSFTLKRDDTAPTDPTAVSHSPNPVLANVLTFSVTFTPADALSTDASELSYQLRTASGGGGTLLDANVCTSGSATTTASVHDADLVNGFNALYLRITDGAGNVGEFVVSVLVEAATAATPEEIAEALAGGDIVVYFTFEQRDNAFNFLADLSAAVSHASIDLDNDRAVVRLARFEIDPSELPADFIANESNIAVNGVLDVNGIPTLFTLGLFRLDLSEEEFRPNDDSTWPSVDGADLTVILQNARFEAPYVIASGTNRIAAIRTLIETEDLEHDIPDDDGTLPIDAVGDPGTSKLDLINRILKDMKWYNLWSTEKGVQTSREKLNPEDEETAVIYSSVNEPRMVVSPFRRRNYRDQPNRVTVKIDDPLRTLVQATIENSDATSSASTARGSIRQTSLSGALIADATMAQAIAEVEVREWAARALGAELLTDFDPRRQPHETYRLHIDEVEVGTYWRVFGWTMDLATAAWGDPLMHHRIGRVLPLTTEVI